MKMVVNGGIVPAPAGMTELPEGAGVFETVLLRENVPVFLAEHWVRFVAGCGWHGFTAPMTADELVNLTRQLAQENQVRTGVLRFAAWRHDDRIEWRVELGPPRPHMARARFRVADGGPVLPGITPDRACKHLHRGEWAQALREARAAGWDEVLLSDLAGRLVEGGGANVFFVAGGVLHTPGLAVGPLPGVMRAQVLALARARGWPVREGEFARNELAKASEIWLTNSLLGVRPVAEFAGRRFDSAYPVLKRLRGLWQEEWGWDPLLIVTPGH